MRILPAPKVVEDVIREAQPRFAAVVVRNDVLPYGSRKGFIPRVREDFGDGGAFPEIHVAQYPLDLGRQDKRSTAIVAVAAAPAPAKRVFQSATDLVEKRVDPATLTRPGEDEELATALKTKSALERIVNGKITASRSVVVPSESVSTAGKDKYINYTPSDAAPGRMAGKQRVIRMVEMAVDPLEPPKFKHKKVPAGPPSPPVAIMHSPPRRLTVADQQAWKIPPVISNWKNAKGYTIPLDKRLAADGRSLMQATINDKFATLSEALYVAERKARSEVEMRAEMAQRMLIREKEQQEAKLRQLAERAREERAGITHPAAGTGAGAGAGTGTGAHARPAGGHESDGEEEEARVGETAGEREARLQRDVMRKERKREREREMRMEILGKKTKTMRDRDRDVTEKIALGMHTTGKLTGEAQFDQRLFNQSKGIDAGFADEEDDDNVYTKAFRPEAAPTYRPRAFDDTGTKL